MRLAALHRALPAASAIDRVVDFFKTPQQLDLANLSAQATSQVRRLASAGAVRVRSDALNSTSLDLRKRFGASEALCLNPCCSRQRRAALQICLLVAMPLPGSSAHCSCPLTRT